MLVSHGVDSTGPRADANQKLREKLASCRAIVGGISEQRPVKHAEGVKCPVNEEETYTRSRSVASTCLKLSSNGDLAAESSTVPEKSTCESVRAVGVGLDVGMTTMPRQKQSGRFSEASVGSPVGAPMGTRMGSAKRASVGASLGTPVHVPQERREAANRALQEKLERCRAAVDDLAQHHFVESWMQASGMVPYPTLEAGHTDATLRCLGRARPLCGQRLRPPSSPCLS